MFPRGLLERSYFKKSDEKITAKDVKNAKKTKHARLRSELSIKG